MNTQIKELLITCGQHLGIELTSNQLGKFGEFATELKKWNRKINLTSITDDRDIVLKHFADSLLVMKAIGRAGTLLDIGSGGGFPAIPLKIILPKLSIISVDAVEKKILFQRHVARILRLNEFSAVHARGEELTGKYARHFDWVVSRAFSDIPTFVRLALPLLKDGGRMVAMKGKKGSEEAEAAIKQCLAMGVEVSSVLNFSLPVTGELRYLVVMEKVNNEPEEIYSKKRI
jgi:16S rRNA (guanine527-N7)-methyltransferase